MSLETFIAERGIHPAWAEWFALSYDEGRNAIAIPYVDALGNDRLVRYRNLGAGPKYTQPKGQKTHLYNVKDSRWPLVYLTEGEFDAIILCQSGRHAVGVPGVQGFKYEWRWLFAGSEVRIFFDGDEPGREGARKVARTLSPVCESVSIINVPDGEDVNSLWLAGRLEDVLGDLERVE